MSRRISIHEAAEIELNDAADFYDIACPNLGSVFIDEVHRTIEKISEFPDAAPVARGQISTKPAKVPVLGNLFRPLERNQDIGCSSPEKASLLLARSSIISFHIPNLFA
jgi:hypothetical protein